MVEFLIKRPIAVFMAYLAVVIIGCVTFATLPVSLLPDIDIPNISVHVSSTGLSAREMENTVVSPLRRQLMQIAGLEDISSETRDGSGVIRLTMAYGYSTDLAFIEVNEKIDAAMSSLPSSVARPKAVKASATDIPVVYLYMTSSDNDFAGMGDIADNIIRRRIEQLPQVAMVDITGLPERELKIYPDIELLKSSGITLDDISSALTANNIEQGNMTVKNGQYEYSVHVSNQLRTAADVRAINITKNGLIHTLGDLCRVEETESSPVGYSNYGDSRAVTMSIIKQSSAGMNDMEEALDRTIEYFAKQYPTISFHKSQSQTSMLDYTIGNLKQDLILGLILVFGVCLMFLRSVRLPFIIGITIITSVIVTFLAFYIFGVTINIISLAGLILAVGMMIDNSVIVAENISQWRQRGMSLLEACRKGTNEMITPLLSSSLTTVAVFLPLVFMSGIAGAIFTDQAFAITAGLAVSYIVGITLLPVLYYVLMPNKDTKTSFTYDHKWMINLYDKGIDFVFAHKSASIIFVIICIIAAYPLFNVLETSRMPETDDVETVANIDWNDNISLEENRHRTMAVGDSIDRLVEEYTSYVGVPDYMLADSHGDLTPTSASMYLRVSTHDQLGKVQGKLQNVIQSRYPNAIVTFSAPANIFEKIFASNEAPVEVRVSTTSADAQARLNDVSRLSDSIASSTGCKARDLSARRHITLSLDRELMALYGVDAGSITESLRTAISGSTATTLRSYDRYMPVTIGLDSRNLDEILGTTMVTARGKNGVVTQMPIAMFVKKSFGNELDKITASSDGEYVSLSYDVTPQQAKSVAHYVAEHRSQYHQGINDMSCVGSIFSNDKMIKELIVILMVSILMMYFILCAQFESFLQPLIVLIEIPIDISFALLSLWLCSQTLNLMSAIGIIVTCGIVVNDSILKIDTINHLRKEEGMPMLEAVHTAGQRRLKPIIMTSLTTVGSMVPVLFTSDIGSELQRPMAIAMIGSMVIGTIISIFIIPLFYYLIYRNEK